MKKIIFLFALLCGSILINSCEKESVDSAKLEGTWTLYKGEALFDGKVVESRTAVEMDEYATMTFSDGYVSSYDEDGVYRVPYTYSNGIITVVAYIVAVQYVVKKLTNSELVLEIPIPSLESDFTGEVCATYKGKTIYESDSYLFDTYWYMSGSKVVICEPFDEDDYSAGWYDTVRGYYRK